MRVRAPRPVAIANQVLWGLRNPLRVFLWTLLALFAVRPAVDGTILLPIVDGIFVLLVVAAMRVLAQSRALFATAIVVVVLTVLAYIAVHLGAMPWLAGASTGLSALLVSVLIYLLLSHVLRATKVDHELVLTAISAYVLIGVLFGFLYQMLNEANPKSFSLDPSDGSAEMQLRYFSLVTLTTVGYGDIYPKSAEARAFATIEALLGQIYLAAVVARLVGMSITPAIPAPSAAGTTAADSTAADSTAADSTAADSTAATTDARGNA